jgi:light-regulated signal transduction histidine kinase (bacteriophytochrome)
VSAREPRRKIDFRLGALPGTLGDRALVKQVWLNLLANGVKYTRPREAPVIEIDGTVAAGEAVYRVKDNGVGFDMQHAARLFGVFHRLHPAAEFEGTGVGLAIVRRIVERHGGRIWAEGRVGEGATFWFALPAPASGPVADRPIVPDRVQIANERV